MELCDWRMIVLNPHLIRSLFQAQPFRPFRIVLTSRKTYYMRRPESITLVNSSVQFHESNGPDTGIVDRIDNVPVKATSMYCSIVINT